MLSLNNINNFNIRIYYNYNSIKTQNKHVLLNSAHLYTVKSENLQENTNFIFEDPFGMNQLIYRNEELGY